MTKIGLLGGSFNPPHQGHLHISNQAARLLFLDKIWWIPTARNPLKNPEIYESYEERLKKCQQIIKNHPRIEIKPFDEIYTIDLIKRLKSNFQKEEFYWIMGADNFEKLHKWEGLLEIIKMVPFAVFSRGDFLEKIEESEAYKIIKEANLLYNLMIFVTEKMDISSTEIRENNKYV